MIEYAHSKKLIVNVGHGLNFKNIKFIKKENTLILFTLDIL